MSRSSMPISLVQRFNIKDMIFMSDPLDIVMLHGTRGKKKLEKQ